MNIQQAARTALEVQNGCNSSGIIKALADGVMEALWAEATRLGKGSRLVNRSPIVAMFLYKLGELNSRDIHSMMDGYEDASKACGLIASGMSYEAVVDLHTGMLTDAAKKLSVPTPENIFTDES